MKIHKVNKMADNRRLNRWKRELNDLSDKSGITFDDVCRYLDVEYSRDYGFYVKIPMKRSTLIGIGMAYGQPLEVINRWIMYYGNKRRLYSKDISEDMIWIYLINLNLNDPNSFFRDPVNGTNYYLRYEDYQMAAFETYMTVWDGVIFDSLDTSDVDKRLEEIGKDGSFDGLKQFVIDNIDSFKNAYAKPRRMLANYLDCILTSNGKEKQDGKSDSLISLRGWLDDSMVNYLSGSPESINVTDKATGDRTPDIKHVPKSRKSHIALALALGMARDEIDTYLELMGFLPLGEGRPEEQMLISELERWDEEHPLQRLYKEKYLLGNDSVEMDIEDELQAVSDMLMLRQELRTRFSRRRAAFEYMKI